jgi:hypothetical protein
LPPDDGLFTKEPLLSGALFVERSSMAEWKIQSYPNPKAAFPLPNDIFAEKSPSS